MDALALLKNQTWNINELPSGKKIGCKWLFTKFHANETIERYKANLVAKGFTKTVIDYSEKILGMEISP